MISIENEEVYRHFKETLSSDLVQNVKPVIMSLTMLAEDYSRNSPSVARSIEEYIIKVPPEMKILGLYLMDSIMKNLKNTTNYIHIFEKNILQLFCKVFNSVDETNRKALYRLRQTWNDVFSNKTLYDIDVNIQKIDPAWPITAVSPVVASLPQQQSRPVQINKLTNNLNTTNTTITNNINSTSTHLSGISSGNGGGTNRPNQPVNSHANSHNTFNNNNNTSTEVKNDQNQNKPQQQMQQQQKKPTLAVSPSKPPIVLPITNNNSHQTIPAPSNSAGAQIIRDPRLVNRTANVSAAAAAATTKPTVNASPLKQSQITSNSTTTSPPTKKTSITSDQPPVLNKSSPVSNNQVVTKSENKSENSTKPTLKRPSSSNLANKVEPKKPKIVSPAGTPVAASTNTNKTSPNNQSIARCSSPINSTTTPPKQAEKKTPVKSPSSTTTISPTTKNSKLTPTTSSGNMVGKGVKKTIPSILDLPDLSLSKPQAPSMLNKTATNKTTNTANIKTTATKQTTNISMPKQVEQQTTTRTVIATTSKTVAAGGAKTIQKATKSNVAQQRAKAIESTDKPTTSTTTSAIGKKQNNLEKIPPSTFGESSSNTTSSNNNKIVNDINKQNDIIKPLSDVDERSFRDVDERYLSPLKPSIVTEAMESSGDTNISSIDLEVVKNLLDAATINKPISPPNNKTNIPNQPPQPLLVFNPLCRPPPSNTIPPPPLITPPTLSPLIQPPPPLHHSKEPLPPSDSVDMKGYVSYTDLPALRPRDSTDSLSDSLLIIDGRQYRLAPNTRRLLRIYYHNHELYCDTRTKDVHVDGKRVAKMGDLSKEITLNGRRVRLMYMGQRVEVWIDGVAYQFRTDSPPKQISVTSSNGHMKRYYVTVDSRNMEMSFNNYRVCQISTLNGGVVMARLAPDDYEQHEISFVCPPKRIMIDGVPRKMRYDLAVPCIEMSEGVFHAIKFSSPTPKEIFIDDEPYMVPFDKPIRIRLNGRPHELAWGGPGFEVIVDGRPYELQFNKPAREIVIGTTPRYVYICGDAPDVKILGRLTQELIDPPENSNENAFNRISNNNINNKMGYQNDDKLMGIKQLPHNKPPPLMNQQVMLNQMNQPPPPIISQPKPVTPNVHELLKKLQEYKILPNSQPQPLPQPPTVSKMLEPIKPHVVKEQPVEEKIPDLTSFDPELLKQKYPAAIKSLYSGQQCATCGNRFQPQQHPSGVNRYARHLDWHFRQNKKGKLEVNKAQNRAWFYSLGEWMLYEELSDDITSSALITSSSSSNSNSVPMTTIDGIAEEDTVNSNSGSKADENSSSSMSYLQDNLPSGSGFGTHGSGVRTCPATDDIGDSCCICNDPFEIFWFTEKEEWHFKDAVRFENKLYHPICFEDAREEPGAQSVERNQSMNESVLNETDSVPSNTTFSTETLIASLNESNEQLSDAIIVKQEAV